MQDHGMTGVAEAIGVADDKRDYERKKFLSEKGVLY
jgi:hypothetical protein